MSLTAISTGTVTLNNTTDTGVTLPGAGQSFRIREDGAGATTRFTVRAPLVGSTAITYPAGDVYTKERRAGFKNAENVGFIKLLDVASAVFQIEVV